MQIGLGSSRGCWSSSIGWVIYSLNEIDFLFTHVYGIATQQSLPIKLPEKWIRETTSGRLKLLKKALVKKPESPATLRFKRIFTTIEKLIDKRNHIAHGVLAASGMNQYQMLRYDKKSNQMISMSYSELLSIEEMARKLSDDFSFLISLCRMNEDMLRPYEPGEPRGKEQITPYDPAPEIEFAGDPDAL